MTDAVLVALDEHPVTVLYIVFFCYSI